MITDGWIEERLQPFLERKKVAPLTGDCNLVCWEEYCHKNPKDVLERITSASLEKEGLYSGDIVIWQPMPASPHSPSSTDAERTEAEEDNTIVPDADGEFK